MSKYRIQIEEDGYKNVIDLKADIEPLTIVAITNAIYTALKIETETQKLPTFKVYEPATPESEE